MGTTLRMGGPGWQEEHVELYLKSDGAQGHYADFSAVGASADTSCLILKVKGRKSGQPHLTPLIYGKDGEDFVIIASKGGAPEHPAWFLNLQASGTANVQAGARKFEARARVASGEERERLFEAMAQAFPPYRDYAAKTDREIPVVVLHPEQELDAL